MKKKKGRPSQSVTPLGLKIKALCEERGMTESDLAAKMGIGPSGVSRWVCGADPTLSSLRRLGQALSVSVGELIGEVD